VTALENLKNIVEAALLAAGRPVSLDGLQALFGEIEAPSKPELRSVLHELADDYQGRGIEVVEVATGWRIQVGQACSPWVSRLWDEKPARYSRALMETLALIAYRQPITRGEIEDIRGVSVSTNIVKTLLEREWVRVVGQRDVPGRPSLYGTTREFLDYFGLKSLDELPTLAELRDLDEINRALDLEDPEAAVDGGSPVTSGERPQANADMPDESAPPEQESDAMEPGADAHAEAMDAVGPDGDPKAGIDRS
jgi:segregation and condensation protein B